MAVSLGQGDGAGRAVAEGALLGSYRYAALSANTNGSAPGPGIGVITVVEPGATQKGIAEDALTVARAVVAARVGQPAAEPVISGIVRGRGSRLRQDLIGGDRGAG